jgi:phosphohistidine phosphatase
MKTLHILRHGKSSWDLPGIPDIDRPLLERGILRNYQMAEDFARENYKPGLIYSSPAVRALHTALIFARVLNIPAKKMKIDERIYESSVSTLIDIIIETSREIDEIMIVGHNPTFTELANMFLSNTIDNIPTSGIVTLKFDIKDWEIVDISPIDARIEFPKKE